VQLDQLDLLVLDIRVRREDKVLREIKENEELPDIQDGLVWLVQLVRQVQQVFLDLPLTLEQPVIPVIPVILDQSALDQPAIRVQLAGLAGLVGRV
jgi:hypothetical protein